MKRFWIVILAACFFLSLVGGAAYSARHGFVAAEETQAEETQVEETEAADPQSTEIDPGFTMPMPTLPQSQPKDKSLNVTAQGKVTVDPDVAYLTLGVSERGETAKEASDKANETMKKIFAALEEQGIEKKDLKTVNFYINPQQDWNANPPVVFAYQADNTIQITVRDVKKVGDILAVALDAGANTVQNIQYDLLDKTEAYAEALEKAVKAAKTKADIMAQAAGVSLEEVPLALSEGNLSSYSIRNNYGTYAETKAAMGGMGAAGIAVAENQLEITAYVEAIYLMK